MIDFDDYKRLQLEVKRLTERKALVTGRKDKLYLTKKIQMLNKLISAKLHTQ